MLFEKQKKTKKCKDVNAQALGCAIIESKNDSKKAKNQYNYYGFIYRGDTCSSSIYDFQNKKLYPNLDWRAQISTNIQSNPLSMIKDIFKKNIIHVAAGDIKCNKSNYWCFKFSKQFLKKIEKSNVVFFFFFFFNTSQICH